MNKISVLFTKVGMQMRFKEGEVVLGFWLYAGGSDMLVIYRRECELLQELSE